MSTAIEQTAHYCKKYSVFCTGANGRGDCNTTVCWNRWRRDGVILWASLLEPYSIESDGIGGEQNETN